MDPQTEYLGEDNKYGVTKSDAAVPEGEELNTPVQTDTKTESKGLFGFGGKSGSSESESVEGQQPEVPTDSGGTNYSMDSIDGSNPTGGTDYSAATMEGGDPMATGGTNYSGASVEGGNPTGGTDYSGADLGVPASDSTQGATAAAPEKKHHLFGL